MSRRAPHGVVLVAGLALITVLATMVYGLSRSVMVSTDKARAMALADAAAKSVATWYAQVLNYDAYTNRAIVANEIMIAQAVTMAAWTQYAHQLSTNLGTVASVIPPLRPVAGWIQQVAAATHHLAATGARIEVPLRSGYTRALQSSQGLMHAAATPFSAQAMVNEVVWTGDPRFFGQLIASSDISAFSKFSKNHTGKDREPLAALVRDTLDSYSRQHGFNQTLYLLPTTRCIPTNTSQIFSQLRRRGGTWLTPDLQDWESADTLSVHSWRRRGRWDPRCSSLRESIPLGWGGADASVRGRDGMSTQFAGLRDNPGAFSRARSNAVALPGYLGLSSHRALSVSSLRDRQQASVRVPVLVRLPISKFAKITAGQRHFGSADTAFGNALWSLGVAETYFLRPPETLSDPKTREFANLFAPFWEARLVPPSSLDRTVALTLAGARTAK